jgi:hypothetical protein
LSSKREEYYYFKHFKLFELLKIGKKSSRIKIKNMYKSCHKASPRQRLGETIEKKTHAVHN